MPLGLLFKQVQHHRLSMKLLHKENLHADFQKVIGRVGGYSLIAAMIASPLGSIIYKFNPGASYLLSFFFFIFATLAIFLVKWEFVKKPPTISKYVNTLDKRSASNATKPHSNGNCLGWYCFNC